MLNLLSIKIVLDYINFLLIIWETITRSYFVLGLGYDGIMCWMGVTDPIKYIYFV